jgi:hypothetical protein
MVNVTGDPVPLVTSNTSTSGLLNVKLVNVVGPETPASVPVPAPAIPLEVNVRPVPFQTSEKSMTPIEPLTNGVAWAKVAEAVSTAPRTASLLNFIIKILLRLTAGSGF